MDKEKEYEKLREEFGQIPHNHLCELQMIGKKSECPYTKQQLKEECQEQCDNCDHNVYVVFSDLACTKILFIERLTEEWFKKYPEKRETFKTK